MNSLRVRGVTTERDGLLQCTEDDHKDKEDLKQAINIMADVAAFINDSKRRKDIGEQLYLSRRFKRKNHRSCLRSGQVQTRRGQDAHPKNLQAQHALHWQEVLQDQPEVSQHHRNRLIGKKDRMFWTNSTTHHLSIQTRDYGFDELERRFSQISRAAQAFCADAQKFRENLHEVESNFLAR